MQRLYSEFPGGYPGLGLLLLRLLTCGMLIRFEGPWVTAIVTQSNTATESLRCGLLIAAGVLILLGFLTPLGGSVLAGTEGAGAIVQIVNSAYGGGPDWIYSLLIIGAACTLALTGPGGFSLDARTFGPRRFFIPLDSASLTSLGSKGQKSSHSQN
jgi:uncharacterized membrane protein YphA (DoxX/SURF4 family)